MQQPEEFVSIVKENEALIHKIAGIYTSRKEDGQDLFQEIVYQLWKSFPSFRHDSKITTWIYRIALNTAVTQLSKQKKRSNQISVGEFTFHPADAGDRLIDERMEEMYAEIKKLNDAEKAIVFLYLEGNNYEEISAITGFSSTNIGTRLGRIRQKLTSQIKKNG